MLTVTIQQRTGKNKKKTEKEPRKGNKGKRFESRRERFWVVAMTICLKEQRAPLIARLPAESWNVERGT